MLPCGCEPTYEGGYGDDGRSSRYSMEWCALHKNAQALLEAAQELLATTEREGADGWWCSTCSGMGLVHKEGCAAYALYAVLALVKQAR